MLTYHKAPVLSSFSPESNTYSLKYVVILNFKKFYIDVLNN